LSAKPQPAVARETAGAVAREARPERVVAVLGMHRSGTSAFVGSLQQRGLYLGAHNRQNRHNPRGNRENRRVVHLNESVLGDSGGSWREPPVAVEWSAERLDEARAILAEYAGRPLWGFKDPRTLLTFEGWERLLPDIELVGIFRHPASAARSLASRPNLPVADPLGLWKTYNERLLDVHRRRPFPVVSFDDDAGVLERNFARVAETLGLEAAAGEQFFTADLRSGEAQPDELPEAVRALYEELRAIAL
jgi:hypothetical protein